MEVLVGKSKKIEVEEALSNEMFTKSLPNGIVMYVEREVEHFDFEGFEVVPRALFTKAKKSRC
jgi:hypothetical protein